MYSTITQNIVKNVRPGLSGIGSIIFREEEDIMQGASASINYYVKVIAPYKGKLEEWFVSHQGLYTYFIAIMITIWSVLFPKTSFVWRVFRDLPIPPDELKDVLHYKV
jgi:hypothetical protein